jgi:uncharacterized protein (DUF305 family)
MALMLVLVFTAGYATSIVVQLRSVPGERSAEAGFARDMSTHHAQAVHLAMIAWQRATRRETRSMGYATATGQQSQIGIMQTWLSTWHLPPTGSTPPMTWIPGGAAMLGPDGRMPGMASPSELDQLETAAGQQIDMLFCQLMIRHHLGGLLMIDAVLTASDRPEVVDLAEQMKGSQQAEVDTLRRMLTDMGATP